jgi:hypothetical protein
VRRPEAVHSALKPLLRGHGDVIFWVSKRKNCLNRLRMISHCSYQAHSLTFIAKDRTTIPAEPPLRQPLKDRARPCYPRHYSAVWYSQSFCRFANAQAFHIAQLKGFIQRR